ncbi:NAD(P)-dependent oxidoreductase [Limnoglobus roseus]|uniref:NAD(P)-dependent oxidoreductase n=1 Tax=Limnoglobus roseus TaxID=2598579 RepID=A0A5C1ARL6_9BACT|nr:NAD(P)-dependent oxidoreductase [Limnoglobus roseus]
MNRTLLLASAGVADYLAYRAVKPRYDFANKHIVITGGSRGLGLLLARQLTASGARLSICSRDLDELGRRKRNSPRPGERCSPGRAT